MGGGNGQKSRTARERKMKNANKSNKGSQLKVNEEAQNIACSVCMQSFLCTTREPALREHSENKHSNKSFEECFPTYDPTAAPPAKNKNKKKSKR